MELEPLRADECCEEVDEEKCTDDGGQVDHVALLKSSRTQAGKEKR